jgi:hypothetical protein
MNRSNRPGARCSRPERLGAASRPRWRNRSAHDVSRYRALRSRSCGKHCRVEVDHDPLRPHCEVPRSFPRRRACAQDRIEQLRLRRSCRSAHTPSSQTRPPGQRRLITDRSQVRPAHAAVGEPHRQIPDHSAGNRDARVAPGCQRAASIAPAVGPRSATLPTTRRRRERPDPHRSPRHLPWICAHRGASQRCTS